MIPLPKAFLGPPIAHRAFHAPSSGRPENSRAAIQAAIERGYGIEIDIQPSADDRAMVFHDYDLGRLAHEKGPIRQRVAAELQKIPLKGCDETIPTLAEVLALVAGKVPLLIEIKDQDGHMGPNVGALEASVARDLRAYPGEVALMSFNPHSVAALAQVAPDRPRGLATCRFDAAHWRLVRKDVRARLRGIPDYEAVDASFISHEVSDLGRPRVAELKSAGAAILCWTVRSPKQEAKARKIADNITFEGYEAAIPGA